MYKKAVMSRNDVKSETTEWSQKHVHVTKTSQNVTVMSCFEAKLFPFCCILCVKSQNTKQSQNMCI